MRYCPLPSVTALRTFSISAGLDASTVTPGRTAPDASLTTPAIEAPLWAWAAQGLIVTTATATTNRACFHPRMIPPSGMTPIAGTRRPACRDGITLHPPGTFCPIHLFRVAIRIWYRIPGHGFPAPARVHRGRGRIQRDQGRRAAPHFPTPAQPSHQTARRRAWDH